MGQLESKPLAEGPLRRPELHVPGGGVVGARASQHVIERVFFGYVAPRPANYQAEFGFVFAGAVLGAFGDVDGCGVGAR
jgi:hypothetical protein